jgi:hypothetical protein
MTFVDRFVSDAPLRLSDAGIDRDLAADRGPAEAAAAGDLARADLVFYGVAHSRGSYEARVFFDNPDADAGTPRDAEHGYAGSFWVFGHDHCYGDEGHCDPSWGENADGLDYRRPHHMEPYTETVTVSRALREIPDLGGEIGLTVVAIRVRGPIEDDRPPMRFDQVRLLTYG